MRSTIELRFFLSTDAERRPFSCSATVSASWDMLESRVRGLKVRRVLGIGVFRCKSNAHISHSQSR